MAALHNIPPAFFSFIVDLISCPLQLQQAHPWTKLWTCLHLLPFDNRGPQVSQTVPICGLYVRHYGDYLTPLLRFSNPLSLTSEFFA